MNSKSKCKKITIKLQEIRSKKAQFECELSRCDIEKSILLRDEINLLIEEFLDSIWPLEILTKENIEKQYDEWQEAYQELSLGIDLPSKDRIKEFIKDPEFLNLMKIKEQQGLTKLVIAPAPGFCPLAELLDKFDKKLESLGGLSTYSQTWNEMVTDEKYLRYFGEVDDSGFTKGGVTSERIGFNPERYGICNGWMISFTTNEQDIAGPRDLDENTGEGRMGIRTGLTASQYQEAYFSGKNKDYIGEEPMIPQEHFALLFKDLYEKYIKIGEDLPSRGGIDLYGSSSTTAFISCYTPGTGDIPMIRWFANQRLLELYSNSFKFAFKDLGVRSVVRKSRKSVPKSFSNPFDRPM